jgi:hypothetical protein
MRTAGCARVPAEVYAVRAVQVGSVQVGRNHSVGRAVVGTVGGAARER